MFFFNIARHHIIVIFNAKRPISSFFLWSGVFEMLESLSEVWLVWSPAYWNACAHFKLEHWLGVTWPGIYRCMRSRLPHDGWHQQSKLPLGRQEFDKHRFLRRFTKQKRSRPSRLVNPHSPFTLIHFTEHKVERQMWNCRAFLNGLMGVHRILDKPLQKEEYVVHSMGFFFGKVFKSTLPAEIFDSWRVFAQKKDSWWVCGWRSVTRIMRSCHLTMPDIHAWSYGAWKQYRTHWRQKKSTTIELWWCFMMVNPKPKPLPP